MLKKIGAFLLFNLYCLFLISAFQENTPYLLDIKLITDLKLKNPSFDLRELGWGNHYIWRLFAGSIVTAIAGFICGAFSKSDGGKIAAIANIPSIIFWGILFYIITFTDTLIEGQLGYQIISIIAIPLTTYISFVSGKFGEAIQSEFDEKTVLGINPYHWIWIVFPLYYYGLGIVYTSITFLKLQVATWRSMSIVNGLLSFLSIIPIIAWSYPLTKVYDVLSGRTLKEKDILTKALANTGIILGGILGGVLIQMICYWTLKRIISIAL
jgi:hypothetical protein